MALFDPFKKFIPHLKGGQRQIAKSLRISADKSIINKSMSSVRARGMQRTQETLNMYGRSKRGFTKNVTTANKTSLAGVNMHLSSRMNQTSSFIRGGAKRLGRGMISKGWGMAKGGLLVAGATAMAALGIMNGAMNQANDIMYQRYLQDQRYSSNIMKNASIGKSSKGPKLSMGNHVGLSLALNKNRHGY